MVDCRQCQSDRDTQSWRPVRSRSLTSAKLILSSVGQRRPALVRAYGGWPVLAACCRRYRPEADTRLAARRLSWLRIRDFVAVSDR
jgi:hypothetical protein